MSHTHNLGPARISREEIETLLVLDALRSGGCSAETLALRLGLSASLAQAIAQGLEVLELTGLVARTEGRLGLTEAGRDHLERRLEELELT